MSKKRSKKLKFNQIWSNQTDLGKKFGLSAIAVGKYDNADNGTDEKLGFIMAETANDDVPKDIREEVEAKVNQILGVDDSV